MYAKSSFHVSVPDKLRVPGIILLIILQQFIFGISSATINRLSSFYGFEPDTCFMVFPNRRYQQCRFYPILLPACRLFSEKGVFVHYYFSPNAHFHSLL